MVRLWISPKFLMLQNNKLWKLNYLLFQNKVSFNFRKKLNKKQTNKKLSVSAQNLGISEQQKSLRP